MPGFLATFDKASKVFQIHIGRLKHFPPTLIPAGDSKTVQNLNTPLSVHQTPASAS